VSLSLYDVLDVAPDASEDEIRAAWKSAIADLGPGDRRFRAYNDAAEVLLDPERRAAYDAELAVADEAPADEPAPELTPEPEPEPEPDPDPVVDEGEHEDEPSGIATWLVTAVGLVAAAVLAVTIVMWVTAGGDEDKAPLDTERNASAALTAAEQAAVPVLSYDYRTFEAGNADAQSYMTTSYAAKHAELMAGLAESAKEQKAIVRAEFMGSGVVRVTDDRADILVLINQVTDKEGSDDFVLPVWATLQMVQEDGTWRVDNIVTEGLVDS
jgi:Mce-associated membrane protein